MQGKAWASVALVVAAVVAIMAPASFADHTKVPHGVAGEGVAPPSVVGERGPARPGAPDEPGR